MHTHPQTYTNKLLWWYHYSYIIIWLMNHCSRLQLVQPQKYQLPRIKTTHTCVWKISMEFKPQTLIHCCVKKLAWKTLIHGYVKNQHRNPWSSMETLIHCCVKNQHGKPWSIVVWKTSMENPDPSLWGTCCEEFFCTADNYVFSNP